MLLTDNAARRTPRRLTKVLNHADARQQARKALPRAIFDYVDGGAEEEVTLRRNGDDLAALALAARGGQWVADPKLRTTCLGMELDFPVLTAPCGAMRLVHPEGDLGVARAAATAGIGYIATSASGYSLERIAQEPGQKWFQAYKFSSEEAMHSLVLRARAAGFGGLVATMDTAVAGNREKDFRNGFNYDMRIDLSNAVRMAPQMLPRLRWVAGYALDGMPFELPNTADLTVDGKPMNLTEMTNSGRESHSPTWEDIAWMRRTWQGPLVLKGILSVRDARRALELGADGIVVSNHGGRQLDGAPSSISMLPQIVDAVGDRMEVLLDSGIRRGSDVLKARALGAKAVLVGRLPAYGLAIAGEQGVSHVLKVLRSELVRTMRLLGCPSVDELDSGWLSDPRTHRTQPALAESEER